MWCHGIQGHIPADFETLDLPEVDVRFLEEWASCEVEGVDGPTSVIAKPKAPVEEERDPTIEEFVEAGGEPEDYPAEGCEQVHSPALEAFWAKNWPEKKEDAESVSVPMSSTDDPDATPSTLTVTPEPNPTARSRRRSRAKVTKK